MHPLSEKKEYLKDLARNIRSLKLSKKGNKTPKDLWDISYELFKSKRICRHEHIAYSLVRGRTYDQVEKPAEHNKPDWKLIENLKSQLQKKVDEANEEWVALHPILGVVNG